MNKQPRSGEAVFRFIKIFILDLTWLLTSSRQPLFLDRAIIYMSDYRLGSHHDHNRGYTRLATQDMCRLP